MADLDSCKRTKYRRGVQFQSWICCLLIYCFMCLPCASSTCLGVDITVAIYPGGDIAIPYGKPLELFCVAENYSSNDIEFTYGGKRIESEIVNSTTRRLYIENLEKNVYPYYCKNLKNGKICTSRVLVDSAPEDVRDFGCISKNLEVLNCSWTTPAPFFSAINYNLTFSENGNMVGPPCIAYKNANDPLRYCWWNTSSVPRYRQQRTTQYFYLRACNVFGCHSQNFSIDHFSIVKPDPPIDLRVVRNGTHDVLLKWSIPHNMVDLLDCGVEHIIEYQIARIDNTTVFHRVPEAAELPPKNKTYRFLLKNLPYAHMQYDVRVYIKSKKAVKREFWSDYSYYMFYTASERPHRPPDTIAGAFDHATFDNRRVIYVYWKQLEEYEEAGANFTYKVLVSHGNKTETMFPDKNKSMSYVILNTTLDALDVTVWSFNINGSSINSSYLHIPPEKDTHPLKITSFTKLAYGNGTYELSWVGIKNIDNYTLFWCDHNTTKICTGRMDFAVLNPGKSNHVINLPKEYRYQFAISANNGTKTSGMVWAKCDISRDGFVMYGFPVQLQYDVPGKSFATLRWVMDCALQEGIITGYNISYCPIVQTSSDCDKSVENKFEFIPNPKQKHVTITNLLPFRTYQFSFALNTIYGQKNIENATARITTSEDTPTNPINIKIANVTNNSLNISWDPPLQRNGNIGQYVIYNYGKPHHVEKVSETDTSRVEVTLSNLQGFTNYSFTVQACNIPINLCSVILPNSATFVRTAIGAPSKVKAPNIRNNPDGIQWEPPQIPGGTVDRYQIKITKDDFEPEIINTTDLSYNLTHCEGVESTETYEVRAVNFDDDLYHGVLGDSNVKLTERHKTESFNEHAGMWSEPSIVACKNRDRMTLILLFVIIFALIGLVYGGIKLYKKIKKMEDLKPVLPNGLGIPEKDSSRYIFGPRDLTNKEEKPSSDEMLLLPNSKTTVSSVDVKEKDENCAASDQTNSTALSDSSREAMTRQVSAASDDESTSSFPIEPETLKEDHSNHIQEGDSSETTDTLSSTENSPYFSDKSFKKTPASGYVQHAVNPTTGYVQSSPSPVKNLSTQGAVQPASTSYVMAGLTPSIFTTSTSPPASHPVPSSGYVLPEEAQSRSMMSFSKLGPQPPKLIGPESLPTMPTLPTSAKHSADSSYIQLQSLDSLPSLKSSVRSSVPLKPAASSGYVSPADVVINKHLNNMLSAGQLAEEPAILDPTMSPDAYCRFSWSTDPANDNLHTLLADSPTRPNNN